MLRFLINMTLCTLLCKYNIKQYLPTFNHKNNIHHTLHIKTSHMTFWFSQYAKQRPDSISFNKWLVQPDTPAAQICPKTFGGRCMFLCKLRLPFCFNDTHFNICTGPQLGSAERCPSQTIVQVRHRRSFRSVTQSRSGPSLCPVHVRFPLVCAKSSSLLHTLSLTRAKSRTHTNQDTGHALTAFL